MRWQGPPLVGTVLKSIQSAISLWWGVVISVPLCACWTVRQELRGARPCLITPSPLLLMDHTAREKTDLLLITEHFLAILWQSGSPHFFSPKLIRTRINSCNGKVTEHSIRKTGFWSWAAREQLCDVRQVSSFLGVEVVGKGWWEDMLSDLENEVHPDELWDV